MEELDQDIPMSSIDELPRLDTFSNLPVVDLTTDDEDDVVDTEIDKPIPIEEDGMVPMSDLPEYVPSEMPTLVSSANTTPKNVGEPVELTVELDPRLQEMMDSTDYEALAVERAQQRREQVAEYNARPDVIRQKEAYEINLAAAKNEDEMTGGNRAGMLPKPFAMENVESSVYVNEYVESINNINALLNDPNPLRASAVDAMLDKGLDPATISYIVTGADFVPVIGTVMGVIDIPDNVRTAHKLWQEGNEGMALALVGLSIVELAGVGYGTKVVSKQIVKVARKAGGTDAQMKKILNADTTEVAAKRKLAAEVAKQNKDTAQKLIDDFEKSTGTKISTGDKGKKVLNIELAKVGGREISQTVMDLQNEIAGKYAAIDKNPLLLKNSAEKARLKENVQQETGVTETQAYSSLSDEVDDFVSPLVVPEKFNAIVSIASDLKRAHPEFFSEDKNIIESLFELTVNKDLVDSQDLADMLGKYALNFDDYVLTVVGSGSEAGKILNKLSQIRRAGSLDEVSLAKQRALEKSQNGLMQTWRRIENMRRGGMVSMIKTAARNLQSATIRAPMEALENIFDTTLVNMSNEFAGKEGQKLLARSANAIKAGGKSLVSPSNWSGSTRALHRIYRTPVKSKELTDYVLDRPEFKKQFSSLFDNINEYQMATGRGKGGAVDGILSKGEDVVSMLNVPNRIQEFTIRRGVFIGELERLVKREYGIELLEVLEKGGLSDLMSNSTKFRPKGATKFAQLVEDSTRRALDVTYAKAPDIPVFADISNFLSRTGLTAVTTPFPRFMFNSMELMAQYTGGAMAPAIKLALNVGKKRDLSQQLAKARKELKDIASGKSKKTANAKARAAAKIKSLENTMKGFGKMTAKDRQNISRNISGIVGFTAAYMYRNSDGVPSDYKKINSKEGTVVDVTSQYPMRQFLWMAEAVKRLSPGSQKFLPQGVAGRALGSLMGKEVSEGEGTFIDWFDGKEAAETFLGASARTGASNVFIEEISNILSGSDDLISDERKAKAVGRLVGDYLTTWAIPLTQIVEIQRMQGDRPAEYTDQSTDESPTVGGEIGRSFRQRGISNIFSPSEEFDNPDREFLYSDDKRREGLGLSLGLGISQVTKDSDYGEYLTAKGFEEYKTGSRSRVPSIRRAETKILKQYLPVLVENAQTVEAEMRKEYRSEDAATKKKYTVEQYVNNTVIAMLQIQITEAKAMSREDRKMETEEINLIKEEFRSMRKSLRKYAQAEFYKDGGIPADVTDIEDMDRLVEIARGFKEAL